MGTLTKNEREGLEDVFLSIQSTNKITNFKDLSTLIFTKSSSLDFKEVVKQASKRLKVTKISHFLLKYDKKKKNLSK
jgi:hypothetical protein